MPPNYIPNLLREFFKTNKDKKINIESYAAATSVILRDLKEDKIDFGFCSIGEKEDPDIKMITLMEYPIKLVVNQKDVLGKMKQLHPEDLMSKPGISYTEGSAMDREINEFFKEQEITPDIHYRTSSEEIQNFVACGLGWAFIAQNGTPMKKGLKILCAALSLTAIMSFSAFAAETRKEYRAEAEPIRTEMKVMEEQMDALRESNKNSMEHFKNIHLEQKGDRRASG